MIYDPNKRSKYQNLTGKISEYAAKISEYAKRIPVYKNKIMTKIDILSKPKPYFKPKKNYLTGNLCPYYNPV